MTDASKILLWIIMLPFKILGFALKQNKNENFFGIDTSDTHLK